jgi:diguanylate cyclase (GGDEF)-like protein
MQSLVTLNADRRGVDRRDANLLDRRCVSTSDRRQTCRRKEPADPVTTNFAQANSNSDLDILIEHAIVSREQAADLRESSIYSRRESVKLRREAVGFRENSLTSGEAIVGDNERAVLDDELSLDAREENPIPGIDELIEHRKQNRKLTEVNERLVIASLQLQVEAEKIEKTKQALTHLAYHDPLTDLPNRMQLYDRITQAIAFAKRRSTKLAVLFLDLDKFKNVNDSLGHAIGDQLLQSVAHRLKSVVRDTDTVSRHGGDEFILLLSELNPGEGLRLKVEEIHHVVTASYRIAESTIDIGATIGVSVFPDDGADSATLIRNADAAMYSGKESGRNKCQFFRTEMQLRAEETPDVGANLRLAVDRNEFVLYFQAQIDLKSGEVVGVEALLRWNHPDRGLLLPGDFIPLAEQSSLILEIGQWVLRTACRQAKSWLDRGLVFHKMAVNISAREFERSSFLEDVRDVLHETKLMPKYLELELTESVLMRSIEDTSAVLHELKSMGVHVSIDDFGTGYSSLSYLKDFPVDTMKIDKSFISEISSTGDNVLVNAIIRLGRNLHHHVVAEGVETEQQAVFLRKHHCLSGQGFHLNVPMPADAFADFLERPRKPFH